MLSFSLRDGIHIPPKAIAVAVIFGLGYSLAFFQLRNCKATDKKKRLRDEATIRKVSAADGSVLEDGTAQPSVRSQLEVEAEKADQVNDEPVAVVRSVKEDDNPWDETNDADSWGAESVTAWDEHPSKSTRIRVVK